MVYTMNAPYRDQLLPVSSRYNAVVLQGCLDAGISPQQFYDADEKYRKAYKARAAPVQRNTLPNANQARCTRSGLFLLQQKENQYEKQTQNKAGLVAAAGGGIALTNLGAALPAFAEDAPPRRRQLQRPHRKPLKPSPDTESFADH